MKLLAGLGLLVGAYTYMLLHVTSTVLTQAQHLNDAYQYVANHPDQLATGR